MFRFATKSQSPAQQKCGAASAAFTLVEIILAIGLATALLLVALAFYHQAADLRSRILHESQQFSTMRLVLDCLAGDLRTAQPQASRGNEFRGDSTSMSFIKEALINLPPSSLPGAPEPADLVRISLTTSITTNGTRVVVSALNRLEEPLNPPAPPITTGTGTNDLSNDLLAQTNQVMEPFADMVRFVRFRYWDGAAWQSRWSNATPPPGVEIILATEALAEDAEADTYPTDSFRRVVFLPGGTPRSRPAGGSPASLLSGARDRLLRFLRAAANPGRGDLSIDRPPILVEERGTELKAESNPKPADGAPSPRGVGWGEGELVSHHFHASGALKVRPGRAQSAVVAYFPVK